MAYLLYEARREPGETAVMCWQAGEALDRLLVQIHPNAMHVRACHASSHEDAMQEHYDAEGLGVWKRVPGVSDIPFTEQEAGDQHTYLARRGPRSRS